jgi:hypothetical protein
MSANLRIEQVHANGHHREEQDNGHDGDENVGDDEPVSQPPQKLSTHPEQQAEAEVDECHKAQKAEESGKWKWMADDTCAQNYVGGDES